MISELLFAECFLLSLVTFILFCYFVKVKITDKTIMAEQVVEVNKEENEEVKQEIDVNKEEKGPFDDVWQNSDAVLIVEEKQLHVHSTILSLASPVFDKMFNGDFKEAQNKQVSLQGKSYPVVEHLLKLIYPNMVQTIGR